jgi:hypothetical protein
MNRINYLFLISLSLINAVHGSDDERALTLQTAHQLERELTPSPQLIAPPNSPEPEENPLLFMDELQATGPIERTPAYYGLSGAWGQRNEHKELDVDVMPERKRLRRKKLATAAVVAAGRRHSLEEGEDDPSEVTRRPRHVRFHEAQLEEPDEEHLQQTLSRINGCNRELEMLYEDTEPPSEVTLPSATASAASAAFAAVNGSRMKTKGFETGLALVGAGVFIGTFFIVWWGEGLVLKIQELKPTLERLKDRLIQMEDEVRQLKEINSDLTARFGSVEGVLEEARDGITAVTQVSGDNARIAEVMQDILKGCNTLERRYQKLDQRLRELSEHLPQEEREQFLAEASDVDMRFPSDVIPQNLQLEAARQNAAKRYNKQFRLQRWKRVETFQQIPVEIRQRDYSDLMDLPPENIQAVEERLRSLGKRVTRTTTNTEL